MRFREGLVIGLLSLMVAPLWADESKKNSRPEGTHKQARVLTPQHDGAPISLNTYCLTPNGELLICVGGPSVEYTPKADNPEEHDIKQIESAAFVQKYSPEGELLAEIKLDFKPTAINLVPGGKEFVVAGEGWMARMTLGGKSIKKSRTPNVGDFEEFKVKALEAAKAQVKEYVGQFETMLKAAEEKLAKLEVTPEADRTKAINAQIEAQKAQEKQFKSQIAQFETAYGANDPDAAVRNRLTVTGIAVTDKDVFVSLTKLKGHGYDVWRTSHDFTDGEKVVEDLGGCCGQLDIQASEGSLLIAENGKFRVGIYDRDGELTKSFGKRDRKSNEGFGSCCNPMNVRCCENGEILTAESSIGDIKRFAGDGTFLGYVGRAKIGGGCKHVAVGYDATRDRYYMQHQDKGHLCVLVPNSEVTGPSEDELLEKAAREGLGTKLIGSWTFPGAKPAKKKGVFDLLSSALGASNPPSSAPADHLTFRENGDLKVSGGYLANYPADSSMEWTAVRQDGKQLTVGVTIDGVENFHFKVTFESEDVVKIELCYEENVMASGLYQRDGATATKDADDKVTTPSRGDSN